MDGGRLGGALARQLAGRPGEELHLIVTIISMLMINSIITVITILTIIMNIIIISITIMSLYVCVYIYIYIYECIDIYIYIGAAPSSARPSGPERRRDARESLRSRRGLLMLNTKTSNL